MSTPPSHGPTVVKGPNNRNTRFFQKREKKWQIQKILMNIMQMNYIGSYFLYFSDK